MILVLLFFSLLGTCFCQVPCNPEGVWAGWTEWTTCPEKTSVLMNFKTRIRRCEPVPTGCDQSEQYSCPGTYSEVAYCTKPATLTTTDSTTVLTTTELQSTTQQTTIASTTVQESTTIQATTTILDSTTVAKSSTAELLSSTGAASSTAALSSTGADTTAGSSTALSTTESATTEAATSEASTSALDTTMDDSGEVSTTEEPKMTCGDCPELNIFLFDDDPYEDGASVLNRFTADGCKYVQFFCRPFKTSDNRTVRTIYDGDGTMFNKPSNANFECRNKKWKEMKSNEEVESLSCVYDIPPTTTTRTTTTTTTKKPTTTTTTTRKPTTTTRDERCYNCSYLVASPPNQEEGSTYLDHQLDKCLSVHVFCRPIMNNLEVDLLVNEKSIGLRGKSINRTFECTEEMKWIDKETRAVVNSVSCAMIGKSVPNATITTTTSEATETTEQSTVESDGASDGTTDSGSTPDGSTTEAGQSSTVQSSSIAASTEASTAQSTTEGSTAQSTTKASTAQSTTVTSPAHSTTAAPSTATVQSTGETTMAHSSTQLTTSESISETAEKDFTDTTAATSADASAASTAGVSTTLQATTSGIISETTTGYTETTRDLSTAAITNTVTTMQSTVETTTIGILSEATPASIVQTTEVATIKSTELSSTIAESSTVDSSSTVGDSSTMKLTTLLATTALPTTAKQITTTMNIPTGTTTTSPGKNPPVIEPCNRCDDIVPQPLQQAGQYNGMLVIDNFIADNKCRKVEIDCRPGLANQNATLLYNGGSVIATGVGSHHLSLQCQTDANWKYQGTAITSISCLIQENNDPSSPTLPTAPPTEAPVSTTPPTGTDPCSVCTRMRVDAVDSAEFEDASITLNNGKVGACQVVQLKCQGVASTDEMVLMMRGTEIATSTGLATINLTCSDMSMWTTDTGIVVPHVMCGIRKEITTTTTTTTAATTTTSIATPAAITSKCNECENMQAIQVPSLGTNEQNGMLIIEHSYEGNNCRVAVVRCRGDPTDNMTILFNGNIATPSAPYQISSSLTCSSDAKWTRLGQQITSVACKANKLPPSATAAPVSTTTGVPVTTTTAVGTLPCSNCNRQFVASVSQANYKTGFLIMDKYADANGCLGVYLSCSSPTPGQDVAFVNPAGDQLACETNRVNMTMTCNNQGKWITQTDKIVETISCGVVVGSTPAQQVPTPATPNVCSDSSWAEWREWSECTKPCGSCGTHQRFRACNKSSPECLCPGTAYQKVACNLDVCVYPEKTCCDGFNPQSSEGKFQCLPNNTANRLRL